MLYNYTVAIQTIGGQFMPDDDLDLLPLQELLKKYIPKGRPALIPALHEAQATYGYLPAPVAKEIAFALKVPLAEVFGVIEFYSMFHSKPVSKTIIHVCHDPACALAGSDALMKDLVKRYPRSTGDSSPPEGVTVERAPCLGLCELAPAIMVKDVQRGHVDTSGAGKLLEEFGEKPYSILGGSVRELTINCGKRRATTLEEYQASGGYDALRKALGMEPAAVINEVKTSGLVGRGGAAFPTGLKWESAAKEPAIPKYVICNGRRSRTGHLQGSCAPGGGSPPDFGRFDHCRLCCGVAPGDHFSARRVYECPARHDPCA